MEDIKLKLFLDSIKTDIRDFKILVNSNKKVTKKDMLIFLDDLEVMIKELKEG